MLVPTALLLAAVAALLGYAAYSSRHARFIVSNDGIQIRGDIYGRTIPRNELLIAGARTLDLKRDSEYGFSLRTNGIGLPGYQSGWFRLNNGEKALAFVTDPSRVAYVPTTAGYSLLVSVPEPQKFVDALR